MEVDVENLIPKIVDFLLFLPGMLWALSFHEFSHGYVAYKLGDPTPVRAGRLTLDPLKHIDWFGFLALIFAHIGWARPVPINPANLRNPRRDALLVALAGPFSNFLSALVGLMLMKIFVISGINFSALNVLLYSFSYINVAFGVFNLFPLPPLDGWRVVEYFWKDHPSLEYMLPFTIIFLIVAIYLIPWIIYVPISTVFKFMFRLFF